MIEKYIIEEVSNDLSMFFRSNDPREQCIIGDIIDKPRNIKSKYYMFDFTYNDNMTRLIHKLSRQSRNQSPINIFKLNIGKTILYISKNNFKEEFLLAPIKVNDDVVIGIFLKEDDSCIALLKESDLNQKTINKILDRDELAALELEKEILKYLGG